MRAGRVEERQIGEVLAIANGRGWAPDHDPRLQLREAMLNKVLFKPCGSLLRRHGLDTTEEHRLLDQPPRNDV